MTILGAIPERPVLLIFLISDKIKHLKHWSWDK
jgi:hypothetical protein